MTVCDCHGSGDGDRGGMDDGDQGGTVVAQRTSGLYGEAGDGDHGGIVAAEGTSGQCGKVGDGDRGGMGDATTAIARMAQVTRWAHSSQAQSRSRKAWRHGQR